MPTPTDRRPPVADQLELMRRLIAAGGGTLTLSEAEAELGLAEGPFAPVPRADVDLPRPDRRPAA